MVNSRNLLPVAAALVLAAACTDDGTEPEEQLTEQEATGLFEGFRALLLQDEPVIVSETPTGAVVECPLGGRVEFAGGGQEEEAGDTIRLNLDVTARPMACRVSADDAWYDLTGDPGIREQITVEIVGFFESFDISGTSVGTLDWESGDRSGTCEVDLALTAVPDLSDPNSPGVTGTLSGMLCGHEVEIDVAELPIE
ncbi:MAG: hypothetical protein F4087_01285 [Gemmatimonadetes bacterium]|nr:hypothetical protein [Gemmatimonadota bacterium]MYE69977.1 hypothetical protein [Gemmatimonadota bacterium]MYJ67131.1 hypothetical protein [Gemmatimonadota bacterium]